MISLELIVFATPFIVLALLVLRSILKARAERASTKRLEKNYLAYFESRHGQRMIDAEAERIDKLKEELRQKGRKKE